MIGIFLKEYLHGTVADFSMNIYWDTFGIRINEYTTCINNLYKYNAEQRKKSFFLDFDAL